MRKSITAGVNRRYQKIRKRGRLKYRLLTTSLRKLPEFLIIGTQKGGTTSLHAYLDQHPMLKMSSHKEPHFFTFAYDRGINYYKHYFPYRWQNQLSGEATPAYFCHPDVPARVHAMLPAAKLILLLRNPVERAFSAHQMNLRKGWETEADFEKVVDREFDWLNDSKNYRVNGDIHYDDFFHNHIYLAKGRYGSYLEQWLKYFGRQQILVLDSHQFFSNPVQNLQLIYRFLDISDELPADLKPRNTGDYAMDISKKMAADLELFYQEDSQLLKRLTNQSFTWM